MTLPEPKANKLLDAALNYADMGYKVFPCKATDKAPLTQHGFLDACTNYEQIKKWWAQWPYASIGMHTKGLLVVDVDMLDKVKGIRNPWPADERKADDLMDAAVAITPSGGRHFIFNAGSHKYITNAGAFANHVDIRSDDGYILVAPSIDRSDKPYSGEQYRWLEKYALGLPEDLPPVPQWLKDEIATGKKKPKSVALTSGGGNSIIEGQRNSTLAGLGGAMRRHGLSADELGAALQQINQNRCKPPLSPGEVEAIAASVSRYAPDVLAKDMAEHPEDAARLQTSQPVLFIWQVKIAQAIRSSPDFAV